MAVGDAERKRQERARMRGRGFLIISEWVYKDDIYRARKYLKSIRKSREKEQ